MNNYPLLASGTQISSFVSWGAFVIHRWSPLSPVVSPLSGTPRGAALPRGVTLARGSHLLQLLHFRNNGLMSH